MGSKINITAADGIRISAYLAEPQGEPRGGLIVNQELFGVNAHIRAVCDRFAADGYLVLAPCFYDRVQPGGFGVGYSDEERIQAFTILQYLDLNKMVLDCAAALKYLAKAGKVGMVGYCSGGSTAWYCASRLPGLACSVGYYSGRVAELNGEMPKCPTMMHWGDTDHTIPLEDVERIKAAHPDVINIVWPNSQHGFNCDMRKQFNPETSAQARVKTMEFFAEHVG